MLGDTTGLSEAPAAAQYSAEQLAALKEQDQILAATFAKIVTLLMHSPAHSKLPIGDLNWLIVPPVFANQFALLEGVVEGRGPLPSPISVALWAYVSPEVDARLTREADKPLRLAPEEWKSGDILWLIDVIGDPRVTPHFLEELSETVFREQKPKVRIVGADGRTTHMALDGNNRSAGVVA